MPLDAHWRRLIVGCLDPLDADWIRENIPESTAWEEMCREFIIEFGDPSKRINLLEELMYTRRGPKESPADFCRRFQKLALRARVHPKESVAAQLLVMKLPDEIEMYISGCARTGEIKEVTIKNVTKIVSGLKFKKNRSQAPFVKAEKEPERTATASRGRAYGAYRKDEGTTADRPQDSRASTYGDKSEPRRMSSSGGKNRSPTRRRWRPRDKHGSASKDDGKNPATHGTLFISSNGVDEGRKSFTYPARVNDIGTSVFLDTGAAITCVTKQFVEKHGIPIQPVDGVLITASRDPAPRIGVTPPIHLVFGEVDIMHVCEVIEPPLEPPLLLGRDLLCRFGAHAIGLPLEYFAHGDPPEPAVEDAIPAPADVDFAKAELEPDFVAFRQEAELALKDALEANAAIEPDAYCPVEDSVVHLDTPSGKVVHRRQYPIPHEMIEPVNDIIRQWKEDGVIQKAPTGTAFNTPIFAIPKKDAQGHKTLCRVCADFRPLNALLPDDAFPLPLISDIFMALSGSVIFSTLDLKSAYHRFLIAEEDRHKTCFTWQGMQYVFARAPFGLKTLPSIFQRVIHQVLADMPFARAYIDDVIVFSENRADHVDHVRQVVQRLTANNLVLNVAKCHFVRLQISLLGFIVSPYGRSIHLERVANVSEWPTPTTGKQLQHYLGFANYFREHVPLMSQLTSVIDGLRQKQDLRPHWTEEHDDAFTRLKEILPLSPSLAFPDFSAAFYVATDASAAGIGAVLYQQLPPDTEKPRWISFQARALTKSERNYSATKRELLAVIFALRKFHYFLWGKRFTLFTDHAALTYLHSQSRLNPMLAGWYELLFDYTFDIIHRPGIRNILPDHLSRFFAPPALEGEGDAQPPCEVNVFATAVQAEGSARSEKYTEPDEEKRAALIEEHHALGHFGATAIVKSIRDAGYNWTNISQEALAHCQSCVECLRHNTHRPAFHQLQSITATLPFDHIAVDLAGPFTTSRLRNHYLHVMIDVHSRFVLLKAIPDKRMETIAALWLDTFTTFGFPKIIQSDNGTEFVNKTVKTMLRASKIKHRLISPYHPRANGIAERAVQTATRAIKKLLKGIKHNWDVYVPFVQYCINQKIVERHGHRPFAVVFGRQANGFADFSNATIPGEFEPSAEDHEQVIADIQRRVKIMQEQLFPEVANKSQATARKTAKTFDKKHHTIDIPINSFVMVRDRQRKSKLEPTNEGPFKVIGKTRGGSYVLEDNEGQLLPHNFPPSALISLSTNPPRARSQGYTTIRDQTVACDIWCDGSTIRKNDRGNQGELR